MATTNVAMALGFGTNGLPMTTNGTTAFTNALKGGTGTTTLVQQQWSLNAFFKYLAGTTLPITTDANNFPSSTLSNNGMSITLQPQLDQAVINGQATPGTFVYNNDAYNIVGMLTTTVAYEDQPVWYYEAPIGVISAIGASQLGDLAWSSLITPVFTSFVSSMESCVSSAIAAQSQDDVAAAAEDAAEGAGIEGVEVGDVTLSLAVGAASFIGFAALIALPFLLDLLLHESYHNVTVYNLTNYFLTWELFPVEGTMTMFPVTGDGSNQQAPIPPMTSYAPPGLTPVPVASQADFSFVSDSEITGINYTLGFFMVDKYNVSVDVSARVEFNVPWIGENTLGLGSTPASQLAMQIGGRLKNGNDVVVTATLDYLDGQHPAPNGTAAYIYNSLVIFWEAQGGTTPPLLPGNNA